MYLLIFASYRYNAQHARFTDEVHLIAGLGDLINRPSQ
jgi:hypothetical protein